MMASYQLSVELVVIQHHSGRPSCSHWRCHRALLDLAALAISFEVDDSNHDRIVLAVFNCPLMGISFPVVNVHLTLHLDQRELVQSDH